MGREARVKRDAPKNGPKKIRPDFYVTRYPVKLQRIQSRLIERLEGKPDDARKSRIFNNLSLALNGRPARAFRIDRRADAKTRHPAVGPRLSSLWNEAGL